MRKKIKRGQLPAEQWAARAAELRPLFLTEFSGMNDSAAATALNAKKVRAPAGGRWQAVQVARVRQRLDLGKEHDANVALFRGIQADLKKHFGREPEPPYEDLIVEATAWAAYVVRKYNRIFGPFPVGRIPSLPAADVREYLRRVAILGNAIALCKIASDSFGTATRKSQVEAIFETASEIAAELHASLAPAIAAGTPTAGTA